MTSPSLFLRSQQAHIINPARQPLGCNEFNGNTSIESCFEHGFRDGIALGKKFARLAPLQFFGCNPLTVGQNMKLATSVAAPLGHLYVDCTFSLRI